ncbi:hypothetical protein DQ04_16441010, partial [Trypanosoma grayi]|uniref:hypothetical protein n=1 Tax=Trypanosoma grayi TaxID=71804 RepID=UPI0004F491D3
MQFSCFRVELMMMIMSRHVLLCVLALALCCGCSGVVVASAGVSLSRDDALEKKAEDALEKARVSYRSALEQVGKADAAVKKALAAEVEASLAALTAEAEGRQRRVSVGTEQRVISAVKNAKAAAAEAELSRQSAEVFSEIAHRKLDIITGSIDGANRSLRLSKKTLVGLAGAVEKAKEAEATARAVLDDIKQDRVRAETAAEGVIQAAAKTLRELEEVRLAARAVSDAPSGGAPTATESNREGSATPIADNRAVSPSVDGASTDAQQPTAVETPTAAAA